MSDLSAAVEEFDASLAKVKEALEAHRAEADDAERHVEEAVASLENEGGSVEADTETAVPEQPYAPPVV